MHDMLINTYLTNTSVYVYNTDTYEGVTHIQQGQYNPCVLCEAQSKHTHHIQVYDIYIKSLRVYVLFEVHKVNIQSIYHTYSSCMLYEEHKVNTYLI